jgi:sugar phosphate isomerase/epimerase
MMIGLNLYTLREFCQTPADIAKTLHKVKAIGYNAVQVSGLGPIEPVELKKMLDGEGLTVCATHFGYPALMTDLQKVIDANLLWGCKNLAIGSLPTEQRTPDGYLRWAKDGSDIGRKAAKAGLTFSYHNHSFEFEKIGGRTALDIIYQESAPEYLQAEIDTYWVQHGGGDPAAWILKLKGRQTIVHFKDMGVVQGKPCMTPVGEGNLNWPAIMEACQATGMEYYIVEQDTHIHEPFESVALSIRNMKSWGLK